jgi:hypothetical protein
MHCCFHVAVSIGTLLVIAGSLSVGLVPWLIDEEVRRQLKMETPSGTMYPSFHNSSSKGVSVYKTMTVFSVTNPWDVQMHGAAPHMQQLGPFTYREIETYPFNYTRWQPNATFKYRSFTTYQFEPTMSGTADPMTNITIPSFALFGLIKKLKYFDSLVGDNPLLESVITAIVMDGSLPIASAPAFVNVTVDQLIRSGYWDPLATALAIFFKQTPSSISIMPDDTWTVVDGNGDNEAYTGGVPAEGCNPVPNHAYRRMTQFRGMATLPTPGYWASGPANVVDGTDATAFHPFVTQDEKLLVWVNVMYRKVNLTFTEKVELQGVDCLRFVIDPADLQSQYQNPDNAAYFMTHAGWLPSPGTHSSPINFTKPFFMDAETVGVVNVTGLENILESTPRDLLETYLDIEPMTGTLFQVHKRLQLNVPIAPFRWEIVHPGNSLFNFTLNDTVWAQTANLPTTMVPLILLDQHMQLPGSIVSDLKSALFTPLLLAKVLGGVAIAVGLVLIIAAIIVQVLLYQRKMRNLHEHEFYLVNNNSARDGAGYSDLK